MEGLEIYDFLRLVFITFIIGLIVNSFFLLVSRKRKNLVNGFTVSITSIILIIVSGKKNISQDPILNPNTKSWVFNYEQ